MNHAELRELFSSSILQSHLGDPSFYGTSSASLSTYIETTFDKLKEEVASGEAVAVAAVSSGAVLDRFLGFMSAKVDKETRTATISNASVIRKCWGYGILHLLAAKLLSDLTEAHKNEFDKILLVVPTNNARSLEIVLDKYHFEESTDAAHRSLAAPDNLPMDKCKVFIAQGQQFETVCGMLVRPPPRNPNDNFDDRKPGRPKKDEAFRKMVRYAIRTAVTNSAADDEAAEGQPDSDTNDRSPAPATSSSSPTLTLDDKDELEPRKRKAMLTWEDMSPPYKQAKTGSSKPHHHKVPKTSASSAEHEARAASDLLNLGQRQAVGNPAPLVAAPPASFPATFPAQHFPNLVQHPGAAAASPAYYYAYPPAPQYYIVTPISQPGTGQPQQPQFQLAQLQHQAQTLLQQVPQLAQLQLAQLQLAQLQSQQSPTPESQQQQQQQQQGSPHSPQHRQSPPLYAPPQASYLPFLPMAQSTLPVHTSFPLFPAPQQTQVTPSGQKPLTPPAAAYHQFHQQFDPRSTPILPPLQPQMQLFSPIQAITGQLPAIPIAQPH